MNNYIRWLIKRIYIEIFWKLYFLYSLYPIYIFVNYFLYFGKKISLQSFVFTKAVSKNSRIFGGVFMDKESSLGDYSYVAGDKLNLNNTKIYNTKIGKYCSIGQNLVTVPFGHNYKNISTYHFYTSLGISEDIEKKVTITKPINIEDGVWIGSNVIILGGVTLHTGCIIGAGSVVTKDVDPYCIAVGNPAKIIKKRFTKSQIESLLKIDHYNHMDKINPTDLINTNVDKFIDKYLKYQK